MEKNQLRALALEVFKNADTDDLVDMLTQSNQQSLPVAEMDNFFKFLSGEQEKEASAGQMEETEGPEVARKPSNISESLRKMPEIDVFKSPSRETVTVIKKFQPFMAMSASDCSDMPTGSKEKTKYDSDLFGALFSGPGSLGVKSPKLPKQENDFPLGLKAFETSLEPQENHSDEDAFN